MPGTIPTTGFMRGTFSFCTERAAHPRILAGLRLLVRSECGKDLTITTGSSGEPQEGRGIVDEDFSLDQIGPKSRRVLVMKEEFPTVTVGESVVFYPDIPENGQKVVKIWEETPEKYLLETASM